LARGDRAAAAAQLAQAQALVKTTEAPYVPYEPQWAEWEPPAYCTALTPGELVGYHRRNGEIAALLRVVEE